MDRSNGQISDIDLLLFDVDNTLYARDLGLWQAIDSRIQTYVADYLGVSAKTAGEVQKKYWLDYGTTIAGLMAEYDIDPDPYLDYVHDVDMGPYLNPNPELKAMLEQLPLRKAIFTNATAQHASNVLAALDLSNQFELLVGTREVGYVPKPHPLAYERCLALLGVSPDRCVFIEDSAANLVPAKTLGMQTILLGSPEQGAADYYIKRAEDVGALLAPTN